MNRCFACILLGLAGAASVQASPIITLQPQDQIVTEWQVAVFEVQAEGISSLVYQWAENGLAIPGATSAIYTTPPVRLWDDGAQFSVLVSDSEAAVASDPATLMVIPDVDPPLVVAVEPLSTLDGLVVRFNEPVDATSAEDPFNYQLSELPGLEPLLVNSCSMPATDQAELALDSTTLLKANTDYRLELSGISDRSGNTLGYTVQTFHVPVPEPSTLALLAAGAFLLLAASRRRRKRAA